MIAKSGHQQHVQQWAFAQEIRQLEPSFKKHLAPSFPDATLTLTSASLIKAQLQRCVVDFELRVKRPAPRGELSLNLIGKFYSKNHEPGRGQRVHDLMHQLWMAEFGPHAADQIFIPRPYAFSEKLGMLLQEKVPGRPVGQWLKYQHDPQFLRRMAQVLVKLHTNPLRPPERFLVAEQLSKCNPEYATLAAAYPEIGPEIEFVVQSALDVEAQFSKDALVPVHGDMHFAQLHLKGEQGWLIDLDRLSMGDPAVDLANVLVLLKSQSNHWRNADRLAAAFLDEYFKAMPDAISKRIPLYEAVTHVRRACKRYRLRGVRADWEKKVRRMIKRAVACIEQMG